MVINRASCEARRGRKLVDGDGLEAKRCELRPTYRKQGNLSLCLPFKLGWNGGSFSVLASIRMLHDHIM